MKYFILMSTIFVLAGFSYDVHPSYYDDEHNDAFRSGYIHGYEHGSKDGRARVSFDFRHAYEYQSAERQPESYDTHQSCDFRVGYVEGYADGYFNKPPLIRNDKNPTYPGSGTAFGGVVVFTETGFRGSALQFGIGQYRHLEGRFNDSISSVRIQGNIRVILFDKGDYQGERIILEHDAFDLGAFRNKAASMIVEPIGYR